MIKKMEFTILNMIQRKIFVVLILILGARTSVATQPSYLMTSTRLPQSQIDSSVPLTVIDSAMIRRTGARRISDVFRLIPGFVNDNRNTNIPVIANRGLADSFNKRINVLVDGQSMFITTTSSVQLIDIPVNIMDVSRIEVFRGPDNVGFGTGSYTATINIITSHPSEDPDFSSTIRAGSHDIQDVYVQKGWRSDSADLSVTYSVDSNTDITSKTQRLISDFDEQLIRLKFNFVYPDGQLTIHSGVAWADYHLPGVYDATKQLSFQQILNSYHFDDQNETDVRLYAKQFRYVNDGSLVPEQTGSGLFVVDSSSHADVYEIDFKHIWTDLAAARRVSIGFTSSVSKIGGPLFSDNKLKSSFSYAEYQAFIIGEQNITSKCNVSAGFAFDSSSELSSIQHSPQLSFKYAFTPEHSVRATYSTATRYPSAVEQFGYGFGIDVKSGEVIYTATAPQHAIKPEIAASYELSYLFNTSTPSDGISAEITSFYMIMSDILSFTDATLIEPQYGDHFQISNTPGELISKGLEGSLNWHNNMWTIYLASSISSLDASSIPPNRFMLTPMVGMVPLDASHSIAPFSFAAMITRTFASDVDLSFIYSGFGSFHWAESRATKGVRKLDVTLSKCMEFGSNRLCGSLIGLNLLGQTEGYVPGRGASRGLYGQFSIDW